MTAVLDAMAGVEVAARAVRAALDAGADEAQVNHSYAEQFEITYDNTEVGMVRTIVNDQVSMTVFVGGAKGQSSLTGRSNDLIDQAAKEAVAAARAGMADPANGVVDGDPTPFREVGHAEPDADTMIDAIVRHQEYVADKYPLIRMRDSVYEFVNAWHSFANSTGLQHQERRAAYRCSSTFSGKDGEKATSFNYTGASSLEPFAELRDAATLRQLLEDTVNSFDPRAVPATFVGDVIFTPDSLDTILGSVLGALSGYSLMRNTSPFQDSVGEAIADARLEVASRPCSPMFPIASTFNSDGVVASDLPIISNGVLANHLIDWYTSRKLNKPMTTSVSSIDVRPGDQTFAEIVANTERGIILGRFSGGQPNAKLDFSGVAKNSFYVEDGKVQFPISETMIAGNFADLLQNVRAIGSESVNYGGHTSVAMATTGATISTK